MLPQIEEKYPIPCLLIDFAQKGQTAQLEDLFRGMGLRGMGEGRNYCAFDTAFPFVAAFIDRRLGCLERCELIQMGVLYTEMVS